MNGLYTTNAQDTLRIRAMTSMTQVMMTILKTEQNAMEVMWNRQKVTARVQKLLRMIIAALDATDCCVFQWKGQDEVGQGKNFHTHLMQMAKYSDKITWGTWPSKESHYALRSMELPHYRWNF
jgi:hypothetical protein